MRMSVLGRSTAGPAVTEGQDFARLEATDEQPPRADTVDDEETQNRKFQQWNKRNSLKELRSQWFFYGAVVGGLVVYWWLR